MNIHYYDAIKAKAKHSELVCWIPIGVSRENAFIIKLVYCPTSSSVFLFGFLWQSSTQFKKYSTAIMKLVRIKCSEEGEGVFTKEFHNNRERVDRHVR